MKPCIKLFRIGNDLEKAEKEIQKYLDSLPDGTHIFVKMDSGIVLVYSFYPQKTLKSMHTYKERHTDEYDCSRCFR